MTRLIGGRYRLDELIAEGGMGEVWRAHDELLDRAVAVKVLRKALVADHIVAERFRREARAAASLSHPNMANVYDYIEEDEHPGIVMELVGGQTLSDVIAQEAPMELARAASIIDQVLAALEVAHTSGLVHRDVKPANVMIDERKNVKVTDFGIARALGESTLTETGTVLGSVHYVSPEQLHGGSLQPASDLYAVGIMLFEMLTAVRPFEGETAVAVAMSRLHNDAPPASRFRPGLPAEVEHVIVRALARDPKERFATAADMRAALAEAVRNAQGRIETMPMAAAGGSPAHAPPVSTSTTRLPSQEADVTRVLRTAPPAVPSRRKSKRKFLHPALLGLALVLLLIGLVALALQPPDKVAVPRFTGLTLEKARSLADAKGLVIKQDESVYNAAAEGTILRQAPDQNAVVLEGSTVRVVVSKGPPPCCTVPSVLGMERTEAVERLQRAGLVADVDFKVTEDDEPGTVIDQSHDPGTTLPRGSTVGIVVATEEGKGKGKGRD